MEEHAPQQEDRVDNTRVVGAVGFAIVVGAVGIWVAYAIGGDEPPRQRSVVQVYAPPLRTPLEPQVTEPLPQERPEPLSGYEWIDREEGIVRVPVDEAVRLYLEEHDDDA